MPVAFSVKTKNVTRFSKVPFGVRGLKLPPVDKYWTRLPVIDKYQDEDFHKIAQE